MLGKTEGKRRRGRQRTKCLGVLTDSVDMGLSKLRDTVKGRKARYAIVQGFIKSQLPEQQQQ